MSNNGGVYTWSKTATANASADNTINWLEGQAPSSINDSARSLMASVAKYRDDISGAIVTTGTSVAYAVASNQNFDTLADFHGQIIAFSPHATNGAGGVTMTVDAFANIPLRTAPATELLQGVLIQGTPYVAMYNNTDHALYLQSFYGNPYNVPLGAGFDFWGPAAPNSSFAFPFGQAISRTTYASLFTLFGTTYGTGDGTTTFNLPDKRGRITAGKDNMGGPASFRLGSGAGFQADPTVLGAVGGVETKTLVTANLPPYTPSGTVASAVSTLINSTGISYQNGGTGAWMTVPDGFSSNLGKQNMAGITVASTFTGAAQGGTSAAVGVVQPTIISNYIIRIL